MFYSLIISFSIFLIGLFGIIFNKKNLIVLLMSIELMLLGINLNYLFISFYIDDIMGQIFALLILTVAAAESAIGLAIIVVYYRLRGNISIDQVNFLSL
jgi:NADH-quinone oxidoreductase subunit K